MEALKTYDKANISALVNSREGETKIGEQVLPFSGWEQLKDSPAHFVLLGIPEDIGIRANHGIAGAATAWIPALKALLNTQSTLFLSGNELMVLGHFEFPDPENTHSKNIRLENTRLENAVAEIDEQVYPVIQKIIAAGKTPIIIGGGHNNAYPILKGCALGLKKTMDVLNIDAHADLRPAKGRHSGNGFSYALKHGFLRRYSIFGLHQNYNSSSILTEISQNPNINAVFFDDLLAADHSYLMELHPLLSVLTNPTGLEIDLDCIENVLSSAFTPSGFQLNDIRKIILQTKKKFAYMHVCEAAAKMSDGRESSATAKTIAYLVTDFIKAQLVATGSR
ncbi:formimidoylglutamase [Pedobacter sp. N36a]|uniref:formimidoylglutamase n=1 Tax=Pedobacter sp. N36a TaxID=2767996 RepID=UPI001656F2E1|nr:formimidoylglutamase [Pedobacter sp. N36a]MBC8987142.1 formimidoylglutamase [Pedobacter sp. N36a]